MAATETLTLNPAVDVFCTAQRVEAEHKIRFLTEGPRLDEDEWEQFLHAVEGLSSRPEYPVASGSVSAGVPADFYARVARSARAPAFVGGHIQTKGRAQ